MRDKRWRHPQVIVNGILAIAALITLAFYAWQLHINTKTVELDQRAWVTISSVYLDKLIAIDEAPKISMVLANSGKSPALDVQVSGRCGYGIAPPPFSTGDPVKGVSTPMVLGPNEKMTVRPRSEVPVLSAEVVEQLRNSSIRLFIKGWISYRDIFNKPHRTAFCFAADAKELDELNMETCETSTAD
jgi:hypothetical protein